MRFDLIIEYYLQRFQSCWCSGKVLYGRSFAFRERGVLRQQTRVRVHVLHRDHGPTW